MERKTILIAIILLGTLLGAHQFGNWDSVQSKESKEKSFYGKTQDVEVWHMTSGKLVEIYADGDYVKFDKEGFKIETGRLVNGELVPDSTAATYRWGILVFMFVALIFAYIFLWFNSKEHSPIQAMMDKYWPRRFVPFDKLSPEKAAELTRNLQCRCQQQKIQFQKEEYDKDWDFRMAFFECLKCQQVFKVKRSKVL